MYIIGHVVILNSLSLTSWPISPCTTSIVALALKRLKIMLTHHKTSIQYRNDHIPILCYFSEFILSFAQLLSYSWLTKSSTTSLCVCVCVCVCVRAMQSYTYLIFSTLQFLWQVSNLLCCVISILENKSVHQRHQGITPTPLYHMTQSSYHMTYGNEGAGW